ncbi:hypothetical protein EDB89DRAFT_2019667 [Lactarius sanguifluus]|nr:hypothetical protein EDB89DRAFT_2019667 [Lactarius sanguifluus]
MTCSSSLNPFTKSLYDRRKLINYFLSNSARNIRRSHPTITHTDPTNHDELSPYLLDRYQHHAFSLLEDRVIRLQRLVCHKSSWTTTVRTSNMLRNRTNLEDLTETNATTIAPAPASPHSLTTAHIRKKFSCRVTRPGRLPPAHPTLVFDFPSPRRLGLTVQSVDRHHFPSIAAERWQQGSGISLIFTCLYTGSLSGYTRYVRFSARVGNARVPPR